MIEPIAQAFGSPQVLRQLYLTSSAPLCCPPRHCKASGTGDGGTSKWETSGPSPSV